MRSPQRLRHMKRWKMKMQVRHKNTPLRLACKYHRIGTPRAKLALLGLNKDCKTFRLVYGPWCATCIFNLQRGPLISLEIEIYSELSVCSIWGSVAVAQPCEGPLFAFLRGGLVCNNASALTTKTSPCWVGSVVMGGRNVTMRFKNKSVITRGCCGNRDSACDEILSRITLACH